MTDVTKNQFEQLITEYARMRKNDVARGLESPHFAALLVEKYASGVIDVAKVLFDARYLFDLMDGEIEKIDPDFRQHTKERYSSFADIVMSKRNNL